MSDWLDDDGYPTDEALDFIADFHGTPQELINFINSIWWPQGMTLYTVKRDEPFRLGGRGWVWEMATGGWSGNETLIGALEGTFFWMRYWESSHRGGGYRFEIPEPNFHEVGEQGSITRYGVRNSCPDCHHLWWYHRNGPCTMGIGGGEICACASSENTLEAEPEKKFVTDVQGIKLENVHPADNCAGRACVIHNPSNHHMMTWPLIWRNDRQIFERQCPHGIGHPDPDQFEFWDEMVAKGRERYDGMGIHGCDGCCTRSTDAV